MRISDRLVVAAVLLLTGCGQQGAPTGNVAAPAAGEPDQASDAKADERVLCAQGSDSLRRDCTLEQTETARGLIVTVRHPDGAFHRLLVTQDGPGVVAADGAEPAHVSTAGAQSIDVSIGTDRYRLPATIKAGR